MIFIKEIKPIKMPGLTSFLISTDKFNPEWIPLLNTVDVYYQHKKLNNTVEIPSSSLRAFIDAAVLTDDLSLQLLPDEKEKEYLKITEDEIDYLNFKPFEHQIEAINFGIKKKQFLLLDSMGCGKTLEIIGLAEILHKRGLIDHCLIICGVNSVKENWANEIAKFGNSSCLILGKKVGKRGGVSYASVDEKLRILKNPINEFFIITNIETFRNKQAIEAINKSKNTFGMIAVDEIHRCGGRSSLQGNNLLKLTAEYLVGATGTLITNTPTSAYLPLAFTKNDHSILTTFRPVFEVYENGDTSKPVGYKNLDLLYEEIQECSIRRTLFEVKDSIPQKMVEYESLEMEPSHKKFYEDLKNGIKTEVDKIELNTSNLLALMTRLRQGIVCPSILSSSNISATKIERCVSLVREIVEQGEKVVILSNFVQAVKETATKLQDLNPVLILGEIKLSDRQSINNKFQEDPNCKVLLGTHQAVGTGLTLNAAMYLIMLDTPWTFSTFDQSCDRIWRINNTKPAFIKVLECKNTIDDHIHDILINKRDLGDYLVDGKDNIVSQNQKQLMLDIIKSL